MMYKKPLRLTRRDLLKILLATGGGLFGYEILNLLRTNYRNTQYTTHINNIIFFIQENHSFDSLLLAFLEPKASLQEINVRML